MTDDVTHRYDGVLERTNDGGGVIRFERHLPYDVGDVWDAITSPERLADWWLPFDADITVDLRVGGDIVFRGRPDGDPEMRCTIRRLEPNVLLEHTHPAPGSVLLWELEAAETGCILRLSHTVPDVTEAIDGSYLVGLHTSLARLEPCLAGHPEPWDWDAFADARTHYAVLGLATEDDPS